MMHGTARGQLWLLIAAVVLAGMNAGACNRRRPEEAPSRPADAPARPPCKPPAEPVRGRIDKDTTWCGLVEVVGNIRVPAGVTLTVHPATEVRFFAYRGYRFPERRLHMRIEGRLLVQGEPGRPVRFTSDSRSPRNGDWSMVKLAGAKGSHIAHAIFEFSQHGLNIWKTDLELDHVVIRFSNWEGLYVENHSKVTLRGARIYGNGYNCIAVEQYNTLTVQKSYIANCGTVGIHVDSSEALISESIIEGSQEGVCLDNDARVTLLANRFAAPKNSAISCGEGENVLRLGGNVYDGLPDSLAVACNGARRQEVKTALRAPERLVTGSVEGRSVYLDYIPGDRNSDPYIYIYPDRDETRVVVRKLGGNMGLTWSLAWDGRHLWTANLDGKVMRLDPETGEVLQRFDAPGPQPWGMAHDGRLLWINDFARRMIHGVSPQDGTVQKSFAAPDPAGGCKGLSFDGEHLYALGWATHRLYQLSAQGTLLSSVPVPWRELEGGLRIYAAGGLTWDGQAFWAPMDRLVRFDRQGKTLGWINSTSERVWDLAWDGTGLWTTQRANENWEDIPRLFRIKVLQLETH